jgi:membrane protein
MNDEAAAEPQAHSRRERVVAFASFLWHRFRDESCFEAAGALSFTTVFALVPLTTAVLGVMSAFPVFSEWSQAITDFVFANFLPAAREMVHDYLLQFVQNATRLTTAGVVALMVSALLMMYSVEDAFNRIWRAPHRRRRLARIMVYWTVLTLGPVLVAASLGLSSYLISLPLLGDADRQYGLSQRLLALLPPVVTWSALTLSYLVIPNGPVRVRNAAIGALFASFLFEWAKYAFGKWIGNTNYEQIYGALAALPALLVWIYVSWIVVLLGASIAASLSAFRFQPPSLRVTRGLEFVALLRVLGRIRDAAASGRAVTRVQLCADEPGLTDEQFDRFLAELERARITQRTEAGGWVILRDLSTARVRELFEAGNYRWPTHDDMTRVRVAATPATAAWLARGTGGLAPLLDTPVGELIGPVPPTQPDPGAKA